jgi:U32 family peptidase
MKKIELLAPAGSIESLYAAVQSGADAVYLGGNKFSARAYASNFDEENMINAVDYCHLYGIKIYITLNTLLKQSEIKEALEYIGFLYKIGVDAVIIQDTGLAYLIKDNFPNFEIHASTQMTVHNGEGALFLKKLGFKRIVLSRELSLKEIKYISQDLNVETEIFIHGALCICYSGQCLMSSIIGGRSGNRGRCAQPCRLPYNLIDKVNGREKSAYILSPKDICTLEDIEKIIESSTSSLKIEGRMKRPEYVAGVVDVYRRAIDSVYEGKKFDIIEENKKLLKLFNREGFSKAYLFGNKGKDMMAYNFPKNTGITLGKVLKGSIVELKEDLSISDGIRIGNDGFITSKILKDGKEVEEAYIGDKVKLVPSKYKTGDVLFKTSDINLLKELEGFYKNKFLRKIYLPLTVSFKIDDPFMLKTIYNNKEFIQYGDKIQSALKKPLEKEKLQDNLKKSADTPFKFKNIEFNHFEEGFLPLSEINSVRRGLIEQIENCIKISTKKESLTNLRYPSPIKLNKHIPEVLIIISSYEQLKAYVESMIDGALVIDIFKKQNSLNFEEVKKLNINNLYLKVPNIVKEEFEFMCNTIETYLPQIKGIVTANLGVIKRFSNRISIIGDYKLNIFNNFSMQFYEKNISGAAVSVELNKNELEGLLKNNSVPAQMKVFGKEELMVSEYCPIGSNFGDKSGSCSCNESCELGNYILKDRKNAEFILKTDKFCRSYIYNGISTNLIPYMDELKNMGVSSFRIDFIDENYEEALKVLQAVKNKKWTGEYVNFTRGHYKRGVE